MPGISLPFTAATDAAFPVWWRLVPPSEAGPSIALWTAHDWPSVFAVSLVGLGWVPFALGIAPGMARLQAGPGRRLLPPGSGTDLSLRGGGGPGTSMVWPMAHAELDPLLLDPTRLSIVSLLAATRFAEFGWVRDQVGLSDSALSKQVTTLSKQGYVEVEKGYVGKRPRTWLNLGTAGRVALEGHVAAGQNIVDTARQAGEEHAGREAPADRRPAEDGQPPG